MIKLHLSKSEPKGVGPMWFNPRYIVCVNSCPGNGVEHRLHDCFRGPDCAAHISTSLGGEW